MIFNLAAPLTPICSTQGKKISTEKRCTRHEYLWMCLFVRAEVCAACGFMSIRVCVSVWGPCLCVNGHLGSGDHLTTKGLQWNGEREHMTGPEEFYEFICARCVCVRACVTRAKLFCDTIQSLKPTNKEETCLWCSNHEANSVDLNWLNTCGCKMCKTKSVEAQIKNTCELFQ